MAYTIIGKIYKIGNIVERVSNKSGENYKRRSVTLIQRRVDRYTGEEYEPYYPSFDFSCDKFDEIAKYGAGDVVRISFDIVGTKYNDESGTEKFFTALRGFRIEPYVKQSSEQQAEEVKQPAKPEDEDEISF